MTMADQDSRVRRFEQIIGNSPALENRLRASRAGVAAANSTVLNPGRETGTGKELIAHTIHNASQRSGHSLIKLNCAAIPFDLLESELLWAMSGALLLERSRRKIGRFELADKGTLFLDEVGDIPLALQPKLLRVLQEQEFERLGKWPHPIALMCGSSRRRTGTLEQMVKRNQFRSDLYYRLKRISDSRLPAPA